jgi:hypothetical protein
MPYWERRAATRATLKGFNALYDPEEVEVILVDDGSPTQPWEDESIYPNLKVIRLPEKTVAKCPTLPLNVAREHASHDVLAISFPECRHIDQTLKHMWEVLKDEREVVSARVWCETLKIWLASEFFFNPSQEIPPGTALNFCVMMHASLWDEVGGFDEDYRDGQAFDDNDFLRRILRVGGRYSFAQGARANHTRGGGATSEWPAGAWARNRAIFLSKWPTRT